MEILPKVNATLKKCYVETRYLKMFLSPKGIQLPQILDPNIKDLEINPGVAKPTYTGKVVHN